MTKSGERLEMIHYFGWVCSLRRPLFARGQETRERNKKQEKETRNKIQETSGARDKKERDLTRLWPEAWRIIKVILVYHCYNR